MRYLLLNLLLVAECSKKPENDYTECIFRVLFQMTTRGTVAVGDTFCHADDGMATNNMLANLF